MSKVRESKKEKVAKDRKRAKSNPIDQILFGIGLFRESRAEILSGSTTYFVIIGFIPMLLCMAHLYSGIIGDSELALKHLLISINNGIPNLAPSIFDSIEKILSQQLAKDKIDYVNVGLLGLSGLGFSQSIYFGLMYISDFRKDNPLKEGLYSVLIGLSMVCYCMLLSLLMADVSVFSRIIPPESIFHSVVPFVESYPIVAPLFLSLVFFTLFYKFMTPLKVRLADGFTGAASFVALFVVGKTLHWVYLHYFEKELIENFGSFHSMVVAVIWIYFLTCAFFLGASIAFSYSRMRQNNLDLLEDDSIDEFGIMDDFEDEYEEEDDFIELEDESEDRPIKKVN